jgi:hypothetical protein
VVLVEIAVHDEAFGRSSALYEKNDPPISILLPAAILDTADVVKLVNDKA